MAVVIRLKRLGRKKKPFYRVVVAEKRNPRDGKIIEEIGQYDPGTDPASFDVKTDRAEYWLGVGAKPSETVARLLGSKDLYKHRSLKSDNQKVARKDRKKSSSEDE